MQLRDILHSLHNVPTHSWILQVRDLVGLEFINQLDHIGYHFRLDEALVEDCNLDKFGQELRCLFMQLSR